MHGRDDDVTPGRPFRNLAYPLHQCPLPPMAREAAPLPLVALAALKPMDGCTFFLHAHDGGQTRVMALDGPDCVTWLNPSHWMSLLYVTAGEVQLTQNRLTLRCAAGGCLVVPAGPTLWRSTAFGVVCVLISSSLLAQTCQVMAQALALPDAETLLPSRFLLVQPDRAAADGSLLLALHRHLQTTGDFLDNGRNLIAPLGLEQSLCRLVAALMLPVLREASPADAARPDDALILDRFDDLLVYIDQHLDQPLNLTLLQSHIHYSRRAVQYAFQHRLGCTATQWIRARRLDKARTLLQQAAASDTVAGIARACGYRSMSLFSIDFQQRFHIKPSVLLRHSRSEPASEPPGMPPPD